MIVHAGSFFATAPREQVKANAQRMLDGWMKALDTNDPCLMLETLKALTSRRASEQVAPTDILGTLDCIRRTIWKVLRDYDATQQRLDPDLVERLESWMHAERLVVLEGYTDVLKQTQQQLAEQARLVNEQTMLIRELSTPIVPLIKGVLLLPLVGMLDADRAAQLMAEVLSKIQTSRSNVLILDVTGVPTIDTNGAYHLLKLARAVDLLGAKVVLVGVRPDIARTVVSMGVDLGNMNTHATLQEGIAYALAQRGLRITADVSQPGGPRRDASSQADQSTHFSVGDGLRFDR